MKNKKGFTLVELLAVIVILAVILVIAVPRITNIIENTTKESIITAVELISDAAEREKVTAQIFNRGFLSTGNCGEWAGISNDDNYESCRYTIIDEEALITQAYQLGAQIAFKPDYSVQMKEELINNGIVFDDNSLIRILTYDEYEKYSIASEYDKDSPVELPSDRASS